MLYSRINKCQIIHIYQRRKKMSKILKIEKELDNFLFDFFNNFSVKRNSILLYIFLSLILLCLSIFILGLFLPSAIMVLIFLIFIPFLSILPTFLWFLSCFRYFLKIETKIASVTISTFFFKEEYIFNFPPRQCFFQY